MSRQQYSDYTIMAAIRRVWLRSGISLALDCYIGDTYRIHPTTEYAKHQYVRALTWDVESIPKAVIRRRARKLADQGLLVLRQNYAGAALELYPPGDEAARLVALGRQWWAALGYSDQESRPKVAEHRLPMDETEITVTVGRSGGLD